MVTGTLRYARPADAIGSSATATVQAGTAATGYEITYLTDFTDVNLGRPTKATGFQISAQLDFGAATALAGMLIWHNFDEGSQVTIQANSAASWPGAFSKTITIPAKRGDGRFVKVWTLLFQSYRYWLIQSPTNSVAPGMKVQCYSNVRSLTGFVNGPTLGNAGKTFQWGARRPQAQFGIDHVTEFGAHWAYDFAAGAESLSGPIAVSDNGLADLKYWHAATGGRAVSLFVPDANSQEAWLARIALGPSPAGSSNGPYVSTLDASLVAPDYNVVNLTVEDISPGGPEWT